MAGCLRRRAHVHPDLSRDDAFAHPTFDADGEGDRGRAARTDPLIAVILIQVVYVTMVYGPIAAFLVEFFPAKIRYTSLSLPYHFGNGWFGGFVPLIATSIVAATGNIYAGLAYPIIVALITVVVGWLFIRRRSAPDLGRGRRPSRAGFHADGDATAGALAG